MIFSTLCREFLNSRHNIVHMIKWKGEVLEINTWDGRVQCKNRILSSQHLINFLTVTALLAEQCHNVHTVLKAAADVMSMLK